MFGTIPSKYQRRRRRLLFERAHYWNLRDWAASDLERTVASDHALLLTQVLIDLEVQWRDWRRHLTGKEAKSPHWPRRRAPEGVTLREIDDESGGSGDL